MTHAELDLLLERNARLVANHLAAENAHQLDETLATLHPDCLFEDLALGLVYHGRAGAARYYRTWWNAFAMQVKGIARHWSTDGDMIAETRYVGRHVGEFFGLPATDRTLDLRLAVVIRFRDGLMVGERFYYDGAALLAQLGVRELPALGCARDRPRTDVAP